MIDAGALRAEWTKFTSIRATMVLSLATVVVSATFGWLFANAAAGAYATATAQERLDFQPLDMGTRGLFIVQLLISALGVLVASSEYGSGTMHASLAAVGRRGRLVAAKVLITALTALPVSVAGVWLMYTIGQSTLAANGAPYVSPGDPAAVRLLQLAPVVLTLLSLFGLALAFLLRSTAAAVNVSTGFLLVPVLASASPGFLQDLLHTYWPNMAALQTVSGASELPPLLAYGLFAGFIVVMQLAAFAKFKNRDA